MKVFISTDIEGTNGIVSFDETELNKKGYDYFAKKMTNEVASVCKGINDNDKNSEIFVKDAHDLARNIDHDKLPKNVVLNRGWSCTPLSMMYGIDNTFDASIFTGYHSAANSDANPMSHTMSGIITWLKINDMLISESILNYYTSLYFGVPVVMVSGDENLCNTMKQIEPNIYTVPTMFGFGNSVTAKHPDIILDQLRETAQKAVNNKNKMNLELPKTFKAEIRYRFHKVALRATFYPNAYRVSDHVVGFETNDYMEFLKFLMFTNVA